MAGSPPGNGSLLERSTEQTPQNHPDQNAPTHRIGRRGPAPDAGPAWQRLWGCGHPAGARPARDRACALPTHDLSASPPLCQGGDLNQPPSTSVHQRAKIALGIDRTPEVKGIWPHEAMPHGEDNAPALDVASGAAQGKPLGHLQRKHVAYPFLGCEVHLVKASTLGGIMSGRWKLTTGTRKRSSISSSFIAVPPM